LKQKWLHCGVAIEANARNGGQIFAFFSSLLFLNVQLVARFQWHQQASSQHLIPAMKTTNVCKDEKWKWYMPGLLVHVTNNAHIAQLPGLSQAAFLWMLYRKSSMTLIKFLNRPLNSTPSLPSMSRE
jgi:hypothetical protein